MAYGVCVGGGGRHRVRVGVGGEEREREREVTGYDLYFNLYR